MIGFKSMKSRENAGSATPRLKPPDGMRHRDDK